MTGEMYRAGEGKNGEFKPLFPAAVQQLVLVSVLLSLQPAARASGTGGRDLEGGRCSDPLPVPGMDGRRRITDVPVGTWVEYEVKQPGQASDDNSPPAGFVWMGIVGQEKLSDGTRAVWLEVRMPGPGGMAVSKSLVDARGNTRRALVGMAGAVMELPVTAAGRAETSSPGGCSLEPVKRKQLGIEEVRTRAGTFRARHVTAKFVDATDLHYWFSKKVPFTGLVKSTGALGDWILVSFGKNATSALEGPVKKLQLPTAPKEGGRLDSVPALPP